MFSIDTAQQVELMVSSVEINDWPDQRMYGLRNNLFCLHFDRTNNGRSWFGQYSVDTSTHLQKRRKYLKI